jgi:Mn-dependent DtxR family transcriptional regulator
MENYLEAIYELSQDKGSARVSDIAERMGVSKASTNSAVSTLSGKGLVKNEKYREIFLTPAGLKLAKFTAKKHHVIQQFFSKVLNVDGRTADDDACAIEHVISEDSVRAMQSYLEGLAEREVQ